jgi:hypothetical protein
MDPASPTPSDSPDPPPRRRGCFGCLFQSGLGCLAFLLGSVAAAALFAPSLLGGVMSEGLERAINRRIAGSVSVGALELAWKGRQRAGTVELLDPEGERVGSCELELPGMLAMLDGQPERWDVRLRITEARIVVEEDGGSNLERALASPAGGPTWDVDLDPFDVRRGYAQAFPYELRITGDRVELVGVGPEVIKLDDLAAVLEHRPADPDVLRFSGAVACGEGSGRFDGRLDFEPDGGRPNARPPSSRLPWRGGVVLGLEANMIDLPTEALGRVSGGLPLADLFGFSLSGSLKIEGEEPAGQALRLSLGSGDALTFEGLWKDGLLVSTGEELRANLPLPRAWLEGWVARRLPPGTRVRRDPGRTWELTGSGLRLPIGGPGQPWPSRGQFLAGLGGAFGLTGPAGVELVSDGEEVLANLASPRLSLALEPGAPPGMELRAGPEGAAWALDGQGRVDLAGTLDGQGLGVELRGDGVGTVLLDHLRGGDGLLPALFGPGATLGYSRPLVGPARFELKDGAGSSLSGRLEDGGLVAEAGDRANLVLDLTRERAAGIVATLMPWLADLERPGEQAPARLVLTHYRLPLRGDWIPAEADLRLDLGRVRYRLHGGMRGIFTPEDDSDRVIETELPTLWMRIEDGRFLAYEELVIALGDGGVYEFEGNLDLARGDITLRCEQMPLRYIQADAPDYSVPATLGGTWEAPSMLLNVQLFNSLGTELGSLIDRIGGGELEPEDG